MVGKLKVTRPVEPRVRDLTDPAVIQAIWDEAARVVRTEAPLRARRLRQRRAAEV